MTQRWERAGLAAAVVLLAARTLPGWWQNSMWLDEAYTRAAMHHLKGTPSGERATMPLYYLFMAAWGKVSLAAWWLRLPSMMAGLAMLPITQRLARRVGGSGAAIVAPMSLAVMPMFGAKAIEARSYLIWACCTALFLLIVVHGDERRTGDRPRWDAFFWAAVVAILGTFVNGLFVIGMLPALVYAVAAPRAGDLLRRLAPAFIGCFIVTVFLRRWASGVANGWLNPQNPVEGLVTSYLSGWTLLAVILGLLLAFGIVADVGRFRANHHPIHVLSVAWILLPICAMFVFRRKFAVWDPRYLVLIAPAVAIMIAVGTTRSIRLIAGRIGGLRGFKPAPLFAVAVLVAAVSIPAPRPPSERIEDWNGAAQLIATRAQPGDAVFFEYIPVGLYFRVPFTVAWQTLHHPPTLPSVYEPRPVDKQLVRFDPRYPKTEAYRRALRYERIWMIGYRATRSVHAEREPSFARTFRLAETHEFAGDIEVRLFVRRSSSGTP